MQGMIVIACIVPAILTGIFTFYGMKQLWRVPFVPNMAGAMLTAGALMQLSGWLLHPLAASSTIGPTLPEIPWYSWLQLMGVVIAWYAGVIAMLMAWRKLNENASSGQSN